MCEPKPFFAHISKVCSYLVKAKRSVGGRLTVAGGSAKSTFKALLWARFNHSKYAEVPAKLSKKQQVIRAKAKAKLQQLEQKVEKILKNCGDTSIRDLVAESVGAVVVEFDELKVWKVTRARLEANRLLQLAPACVLYSKRGTLKNKPFIAGMCCVTWCFFCVWLSVTQCWL